MRAICVFGLALVLLLAGCQEKDETPELQRKLAEAEATNDWPVVVETATRLLEKNPDDMDVLQSRATAYVFLKQPDRALPDLDRLCEARTQDADLFLARADIYFDREDYENARKDYTVVAQLSPRQAKVHANLAAIYMFEGNSAEAVNSFNRAIELDPYDAVNRALRAYANIDCWNYDDALKDINLLMEVAGDTAEVMGAHGRLLIHYRRYTRAEAELQKAVKIDPDYSDGLFDLAWVTAILARHDEADKHADTFDAAFAKESEAFRKYHAGRPAMLRATLAVLRGDKDKALPAIEKAAGEGAEPWTIEELYSQFWLRAGDYDKALEHAERFIKAAPENPYAYEAKARALMRRQKWGEAREAVGKAMKMRPEVAEFAEVSGMCALKLGQDAPARADFSVAATCNGSSVWAFAGLAVMRQKQARKEDGARSANEAIDLAEYEIRDWKQRQAEAEYDAAVAYAARAIQWTEERQQKMRDFTTAFDHLKKAMDAGYSDREWIKIDPLIDSLRDDERFKEILGE